jgi:neutral ceramidase
VKLLVCLACLAAAQARAGDLQVGRAAVTITPPAGMPMAGNYATRLAKGVLDDLRVRAVVLEKDGVKAAIVVLDFSNIGRPMVAQLRRAAARETGIPEANIMIGATHTHSGPVIGVGGPRHFQWIGGELPIAREYAASLPSKFAEAVKTAVADLRPAKASAAVGHETALSYNRRALGTDGQVLWQVQPPDPTIERALGPIDEALPVVLFQSPDGKPLVNYVNFAAHVNVVGGDRISADFPGALDAQLRLVDRDMLTVFSIGAAGNINPLRPPSWYAGGVARAQRVATLLAAGVMKTHRELRPVAPGPLAVRSEVVPLAAAPHTPEDVARAKEAVAHAADPKPPPLLELAKASRVLENEERRGRPIEAEVQVIALGRTVAWVGIPGELFVELGLAIKNASPFPVTIVAEQTNGALVYIPNRKAYQEGHYEAIAARCAPGSGEILVDAAARLLVDLYAAASGKVVRNGANQ